MEKLIINIVILAIVVAVSFVLSDKKTPETKGKKAAFVILVPLLVCFLISLIVGALDPIDGFGWYIFGACFGGSIRFAIVAIIIMAIRMKVKPNSEDEEMKSESGNGTGTELKNEVNSETPVVEEKKDLDSTTVETVADLDVTSNGQMKNITIRQGVGDDALEMTVKVTQEEFEKMEELRRENPEKWPGYSLELVKAVKDALVDASKVGSKVEEKGKAKKWIWIVVAAMLVVVGVVIWLFVPRGSIVQGNDLDFQQLKGTVKNVCTLEFDAIDAFGAGNIVLGKPRTGDVKVLCFNSHGELTKEETIVVDGCCENGIFIINEENLKVVYKKAVSLGMPDSYEELKKYLQNGEHNRKNYYDVLKSKGLEDDYDEFVDFIGRVEDRDWVDVLADFSKKIKEQPNATEKKLMDAFPEFNNDVNMLHAAYDYDVTAAAGNYNNLEELKSVFPEFWPEEEQKNNMHDFLQIKTDSDIVSFVVIQGVDKDDHSISSISVEKPNDNRNKNKSYQVDSHLSSKKIYLVEDATHRTVNAGNSLMRIEYDKKMNPKSSIETFVGDDTITIAKNYRYRGNKDKWKQIETIVYSPEIKEKIVVTRNYDHYKLNSIIVPDGYNEFWAYNESGEVVSYKVCKGDAELSDVRYSDYVYDDNGNWIRRTNYDVVKDKYTVTERCIQYY